MEVSTDEKADILNKLKTEHNGESFSNASRKLWGLTPKNKSESMKGNKNAKKRLQEIFFEIAFPEIKLDTQLDKTLEKIRVEYKNDFRAFFEDLKKKSQSGDKS